VFSFFPLIFSIFICSTCIARFCSRSCSTYKTSWSSIESASRGEFSSHGTDKEIRIEKCISVLDLFTRSHCIVVIIKISSIFFYIFRDCRLFLFYYDILIFIFTCFSILSLSHRRAYIFRERGDIYIKITLLYTFLIDISLI